MNARVLIIDDDQELLDLLDGYLRRFQFSVLTASDAEHGLEIIAQERPDLVVLDVMMPGMDGFEACRQIRRHGDIPILMLSARGETTDRIVGLEMGADDYMAKPFEPRELVTRIRAILRRSSERARGAGLRFGELEIRSPEREAYLSGRAVGLTSMEFEMLSLLAENPGRKLGRDEIMNHLQGSDSGFFSRSIDTLVSRLRSKLRDNVKEPKYIKSAHGFGYVFIGERP
jgi:DNA-binding response OmpR family regulator